MISSAVLCQTKGLGGSFQLVIQARIETLSCRTERWTGQLTVAKSWWHWPSLGLVRCSGVTGKAPASSKGGKDPRHALKE